MSTGIMEIKKALGAHTVTMKYEDGGRVQVYSVDGVEHRLAGALHTPHVIAAIKAARQEKTQDD